MCGLAASVAKADEGDAEFAARMRTRRNDFLASIKARSISSENERVEAARQVKARIEAELETERRRRAHVVTMKRYSMEQIEALDRADEERLAKVDARVEERRQEFVLRRKRFAEIENFLGQIDPYAEADIHFEIEPESKASAVEKPKHGSD